MANLLQFLLTYKFKNSKPTKKNGGFTLIELLVGLVMAFLVILPLLGFMVNMLQTDRQEQAKANSEQEIQAALDYIARDLEQAVYIYDGDGLNKIRQQVALQDTTNIPVLVFWKRQFVSQVLPTGNASQKDDAFVYALVAYYIRKNTTCATSPWSCTAQITRIQIKDAIQRKNPATNQIDTIEAADPGFQLFDPKGASSVTAAMNSWQKGSGNLPTPDVLIDYIDQTPPTTSATPGAPSALCPTAQQQVPLQSEMSASGFYACVDVNSTSAKVFIRGNALARLRQKANPPTYVASQSTYFPSVSMQVKGRGLFNVTPTQ